MKCDMADMADLRRNAAAKRAAEIAVTGGHSLLLIGPPGTGKFLLARRLAGIMPGLRPEECLELTEIHSVAGLLVDGEPVTRRPFRAPHHTVGEAGLVGGGVHPRPGEASLAHRGVLFLDEVAEFRRSALESLNRVLEIGQAEFARRGERASFPARPLVVVGATNRCPCGFHGSPGCRCTEAQRKAYEGRVPFGLFALRVDMDPASAEPAEPTACSADMLARVIAGRGFRSQRPNPPASATTVDRVARTIADLAGSVTVTDAHMAEASALATRSLT